MASATGGKRGAVGRPVRCQVYKCETKRGLSNTKNRASGYAGPVKVTGDDGANAADTHGNIVYATAAAIMVPSPTLSNSPHVVLSQLRT